jgi:peptidoglycan-associated lipoprotein
MKMNKIIFPLVIALVATLAATGCKKGTPKITVIPGPRDHIVGDTGNPNTIPNTPPINPEPVPTFNDKPPGNIPTTPDSEINLPDYNQDRAALAAYTVHFKFDSAVVQDKEQANIASVGQALSGDANLKLLIEGHCDERGTEEYNRALGERRALALREALAKIGVDAMRIKTISYGKDKPADTGHAESAWSKNRRGEFVLLRHK